MVVSFSSLFAGHTICAWGRTWSFPAEKAILSCARRLRERIISELEVYSHVCRVDRPIRRGYLRPRGADRQFGFIRNAKAMACPWSCQPKAISASGSFISLLSTSEIFFHNLHAIVLIVLIWLLRSGLDYIESSLSQI